MTIVSADGQDVRPFKEPRVLIGVAETYDVLVTPPGPGAYELRATAPRGPPSGSARERAILRPTSRTRISTTPWAS